MSPQSYSNVLQMIGHTPLVAVNRLDTGRCRLFLKLENQNPGGSIKDRVGLYLIEAAEREGRLPPGGTLIEATAGNTGLGLALVAAQKGYRLLLVIPDKMSQEKIFHLKAMGAEVVLTRSDVSKGHPEYYRDLAERLATRDAQLLLRQPVRQPRQSAGARGDHRARDLGADGAQPRCRRLRRWDGWHRHRNIAIPCARVAPEAEIVLADPVGSVLAEYVKTGKMPQEHGSWLVEGIGGDYVPPVADLGRVKSAYTITDAEAFKTCRELLAQGGNHGRNLHAARWSPRPCATAASRRSRSESSRLVCDSGNKYLSKVYNDYWMLDQGFLERERFGDLRDLIARRHWERAAVTVNATEPVMAAYRRMKLYDVSQLPVMQNGRIVGIVDEEDILLEVFANPKHFNEPVTAAMESHLVTVPVDAPVQQLMEIFNRGMVAIVMNGSEIHGAGHPHRPAQLAAPPNVRA